MCFPGRRTHITRDICFPGGGTKSLGMCFPGGGTHITRDMCFPGGGTHITRDMCFPGKGTHITRDMCSSGGGVNRRNSLRSYRYTQTPLHGLKLNTETSHYTGLGVMGSCIWTVMAVLRDFFRWSR